MKKAVATMKLEMQKAAPYKGIILLILDSLFHKIILNTDPRDYFKYEFFKGGKSLEEKGRFVSLLGSRYFPFENNPLKFNILFANKYIQKFIFNYLDLPTPALITTIGEQFELNNQHQLNSFLATINKDIVIKPISGTQGDGILSISRKGKKFYKGDQLISKDMIWNHVNKRFMKSFIVEEKIYNTEKLRAIHSQSLNSYRITMIKTRDNKWHHTVSVIKFGRGGSQVDNLSMGGILVAVNSYGIATQAYDYLTSKPITHHPNTGYPLVGVEMDNYREIVELAYKASENFHFLGTIGWDIASTDKGPQILEANAWWGNPQACTGEAMITKEIAKGLKRRNIFSRWDKTKMYPGFYKPAFLKRIRSFFHQ